MRSYDDAVIDAAIALYSSKQMADPYLSIGLAEQLIDALVEAKYVDPPEDGKPDTTNQSNK